MKPAPGGGAPSPPRPLHPDQVATARNPPTRHRNAPIHLPLIEFHNRSPVVFVTVCSARRRPLFARTEIDALLVAGWRAANHWQVGHYTILPDHIHFFCAPVLTEASSLTDWIKFWKTYVARRWPHSAEQPIWQPGFWDRQLRSVDSYGNKWDYVRHNPVRHSLVARPEDWPYQGELNVLEWHDP